MDCYTASFHWVFVLLFLTDTVSSQKKVTGFTGQDVILPCSSSDDGNPLGDVTVFWRTNDDRNVYDVLSAKPDLSDQHPQFRDRTSHFPEEYGKGNFSIKLRNVRVSDTGMYDCFIPVVGVHHQLYLTVRDKPVEPTAKSDNNSGVSLRLILSFFLLLLIG